MGAARAEKVQGFGASSPARASRPTRRLPARSSSARAAAAAHAATTGQAGEGGGRGGGWRGWIGEEGWTLAEPVRLLGQAAPGTILVSAPVARLVEGWFEVQAGASPVGEAPDDLAGAYTVLGLRPQRSPLTLHGQRPLSRFVGRARECALFAEL